MLKTTWVIWSLLMSSLIIVTGLPATGKSTLATALSLQLGIPLVSKDDIKETMADSLGSGDRSLSKKYGKASFDIQFKILDRCLAANTSVIAETYFHDELATGAFARLIADHSCLIIQIVLCSDPDVIIRRFKERSIRGKRHSIHADSAVVPELERALAAGEYNGVPIDCPTLVVDTTDFASVNNDSICEFIHRYSTPWLQPRQE
jgi:predicted kinase